jgi:magnesium transporter
LLDRRRHLRRARRPVLWPPDALPPSLQLIAYDAKELAERDGKTLAEIDRAPTLPPKIWLDVQGLADLELIRALGERCGLHPLTIADIVHVDQRPKVESYDDYLFIVLRLPHRDDGLLTEQISFVLGQSFVLTFQERPGDCFDPVRERLRSAASPLRERGSDYLAYRLIDALVDNYFRILERLGELIEDLEERVRGAPAAGRVSAIHRTRRQLLELRRVLWPQREVVHLLAQEGMPCIDPATRVFFRDCADHAFQLMDMIKVQRELAASLLDLHLSSLSARMNEIMKLLTMIATIFIPLGFIASLYGMNLDPEASPYNMPELEWRFGYLYALALMGALARGLVGFFYRQAGSVAATTTQTTAPPHPTRRHEAGVRDRQM